MNLLKHAAFWTLRLAMFSIESHIIIISSLSKHRHQNIYISSKMNFKILRVCLARSLVRGMTTRLLLPLGLAMATVPYLSTIRY
jgi:hypothetical protein